MQLTDARNTSTESEATAMINLLEFNKTQKRLVQNYVKRVAVRIPTIFDFGFALNRSARAKTAPQRGRKPAVKPARHKPYFLLGDGAFGGLTLHGLMVLKGRQSLFEEIQSANLHAPDRFLPERLAALAKLFKSKRFKQNGAVRKPELKPNV
jgi:hypothetical protein